MPLFTSLFIQHTPTNVSYMSFIKEIQATFLAVISATCISCHKTSSEVTNSCWAITFGWHELLAWNLRQCVRLVPTNRLICSMIFSSQAMTSPWSQISELTHLGELMYHLMQLDERKTFLLDLLSYLYWVVYTIARKRCLTFSTILVFLATGD